MGRSYLLPGPLPRPLPATGLGPSLTAHRAHRERSSRSPSFSPATQFPGSIAAWARPSPLPLQAVSAPIGLELESRDSQATLRIRLLSRAWAPPPDILGSNPATFACWLCDLDKSLKPLCASIYPFVKWRINNRTYPTAWLWGLNKLTLAKHLEQCQAL